MSEDQRKKEDDLSDQEDGLSATDGVDDVNASMARLGRRRPFS